MPVNSALCCSLRLSRGNKTNNIIAHGRSFSFILNILGLEQLYFFQFRGHCNGIDPHTTDVTKLQNAPCNDAKSTTLKVQVAREIKFHIVHT